MKNSKIEDEFEKELNERYKDYPISKKDFVKFYLRKIGEKSLCFNIKKMDKRFKINSNYKNKVFDELGNIKILVSDSIIMNDEVIQEFVSLEIRNKAYQYIIDTLMEFVEKFEGFVIIDDECYNCPIPWCDICGRYTPKLKKEENNLFIIKRGCKHKKKENNENRMET